LLKKFYQTGDHGDAVYVNQVLDETFMGNWLMKYADVVFDTEDCTQRQSPLVASTHWVGHNISRVSVRPEPNSGETLSVTGKDLAQFVGLAN